MSDFSDSSPAARPAADSATPIGQTEALQTALQQGLAALKQQDYPAAIAHLQPCRASRDPMLRLKAQMGLVKAYARSNQIEDAAELCRPLRQHPNPQVQRWAEQIWREIGQELGREQEHPLDSPLGQPAFASDSTSDSTSDSLARDPLPDSTILAQAQPDSTGFTPLVSSAPSPADRTGFVPLNSNPAAAPRPGSHRPDPQPRPFPEPLAEEPLAEEPLAEEPPAQDRQTDFQAGIQAGIQASFEATDFPWQNAGRSSRWTGLGRVDASGLWALQAGSLVLLFVLLKVLLEALIQVWNSLTVWLSQLLDLPRLLLPESIGIPLVLGLVALGLASPWLLRLILQRAYGLRPFSLAQLERSSPESVRLLRRVAQRPLPSLDLLPTEAPLIFTIGYLPRQARLVLSQGLLDQLQENEIATLVAAELAHIRYWDFGAMTLIVLVCQLPYLIYWQVASWGDRPNPILRTLTIVVSSIGYGLFWWLRLAGLWLSRVRLYYSDRLAADLTGNPNGLARALLKLAIGTASEIQDQKSTSPPLEGFELLAPVGYRNALTLGSLYDGDPNLLTWDQQNPYRRWLVLNNTHPLLGERLALLMQYGQQWRLEPELRFAPASRRSARWGRLGLQGAPFWGIPIGVLAGFLLWGLGWLARQWRWFELDWLTGNRALLLACALLGFGIGLFLRINAFYPDIKRTNLKANPDLKALLTQPDALPLDSQPVQFKGTLLGRPGLQNWLHRDLTLQTSTGLIRLHYTSRLGWIGDLFPQAIRPTAMLNRTATVTGWFRRGATPWIDVETIQSEYGRTLRSYHPIWSTVLASAAVLLAVWLILRGGN